MQCKCLFYSSRYGRRCHGSNRCAFKRHRQVFLHLLLNCCFIFSLLCVTTEECVTHGDDRHGRGFLRGTTCSGCLSEQSHTVLRTPRRLKLDSVRIHAVTRLNRSYRQCFRLQHVRFLRNVQAGWSEAYGNIVWTPILRCRIGAHKQEVTDWALGNGEPSKP